jgi:hypothetical protein
MAGTRPDLAANVGVAGVKNKDFADVKSRLKLAFLRQC